MTSMVYPQPTTGYEDDDDDQPMRVDIHMLKMNKSITLDVNINSTVADVREQAASKLGLPRRRLMLIFNGSQLEDHEEIKYLGIRGDCTIFGMKCSPGEQMGIFELDPSNLDPQYDYDFTDKSDDGSTYLRGGQVYQRPYGWKRYAVKVHGEYENDTWLGEKGIRTYSSPGEWAVSYHGTEKRCVKPILEEGYKIGSRERFGRAVYSSPNLEKIDEHRYTKKFTKDGKRYKFALQNRVDPNHLEVIPPEKTGYPDFPYWLCPMQDPENGIYHVRPYGILTQEL
ncbi:uncharacterized protein LOC119745173 [Patiria miniata]|uniref:Ubiquitin-like domain-containing protein n=1 Tax=Patiria miniata TaxID=46514 RepID=A0A914BMI3_PATMI|nr:uncharacterized protein LOC119745173 [Patiria miniata]